MNCNKKRGVTLLLAVLISSVVLALGLGIASVVLNELSFAGTAKESLVAFYAAYSGMECALRWDYTIPGFRAPGPPSSNLGSVDCGGESVSVEVVVSESGQVATTKFSILIDTTCADITVTKKKEGSDIKTTITSLGENRPCGALASGRTVQRGIEASYYGTN